jgi:hypothetical protein
MRGRYYAFTTTNPAEGWSPLTLACETRAQALAEGYEAIIAANPHHDIYRDTEQKNLIVLSVRNLRRVGWTEEAISYHLARTATGEFYA